MNSFNGMPIRESHFLTVSVEDWSQVRSKSRALRRMKRGFRQRVRILHLPDPQVYVIGSSIHAHPETVKELFRRASAQEGTR